MTPSLPQMRTSFLEAPKAGFAARFMWPSWDWESNTRRRLLDMRRNAPRKLSSQRQPQSHLHFTIFDCRSVQKACRVWTPFHSYNSVSQQFDSTVGHSLLLLDSNIHQCYTPKQGSDLIDLRLTWKEMENFIFAWFMKIFGEFLEN